MQRKSAFKAVCPSRLIRFFPLVAMVAVVILVQPVFANDRSFTVIGTGGVTGVYFPAGGALCRVINAERHRHGTRCSIEASPGSVHNVRAVASGDFDFGIVQSDVLQRAYSGKGAFEAEPVKKVRSLFSLHYEAFTVVARAGSGIATLEDLKGKRVNVGNPGSGQRSVVEAMRLAANWPATVFSKELQLTSRAQSRALCSDQVDAIVFMAGHPNASIREALLGCDSYLVPVEGPSADALMSQSDYLDYTVIEGDLYGARGESVPSFGGLATVIVSQDMSDELAYQIVKTVVENLDQLAQQHDALADLNPTRMAERGLTAPLHPGALKYFQDAGILN